MGEKAKRYWLGVFKQVRDSLKNYGTLVSVFSALLMFLLDIGVDVDPGKYEFYVGVLLLVLVGAGIVSNPESGKGYRNIDKVEDLEDLKDK